MEKKALLAILLSIFVIFIFEYVFIKQPVQINQDRYQQKIERQIHPNKYIQLIENERIRINYDTVYDTVYDTDKYRLTFTNRGGALRKIELKEYIEKETWFPMVLYETEPFEYSIFDIVYTVHQQQGASNNLIYQVSRIPFGLLYSLDIPNVYGITKSYRIEDGSYLLQLELTIENFSNNKDLQFEYSIIAAAGINISAPLEERHSYGLALVGDNVQRRLLTKIDENGIEYRGDVKWAGVKNKYFSILLAHAGISESVQMRRIEDNPVVSIKMSPILIPPKTSISETFFLYAGPDNIEIMKSYGMGFERVVNFGMFDGISRILLSILRFFFKISNNYGLSIILLTILVSLILLPLTFKSFSATRQMQKIQPHLNKLREEHKNNPQKLNKELIELYKHHKVNPLGGCLPLLLQTPIFIALYQALTRSIELRGAAFLWIDDLSMPDAAFTLPFSLPILGSNVNILPVLMIIAMFFQQKISQAGMGLVTAQQKQLSLLMPLIFGIIFYNLPSGLVLYWFTNTLIMSMVQWKILSVKS